MNIVFGIYSIQTKKENGAESIYDVIRKKWVIMTPEEEVRQLWLHYLIHDCNISKSVIAVEKGFKINDRIKRFDICVYNQNLNPHLLIECKSPQIALKNKSFEQVSIYNIHLKCSNFIVTNGIQHSGIKIIENKLYSLDKIQEIF
jgi:hypothetical protein